jgi:peptidoglycan/xylan/chitin deacetylase (PgdA/CDA1 family)
MSIKQRIKIAVFTTSKWLGLFHLSRYLMRRRLMILCYHGFELEDEAAFRPSLFMRPELFERRMLFIKHHRFPVLGLQDALTKLKQGTLPANAVVITIDDGFFSVLDNASLVLQRNEFPATLYVTSYYVSKGTPIFRIVVQYLFWKTPAKVLESSGQEWFPTQNLDLEDRTATHKAMWQIIDYGEKQCDEAERQTICEVLADALHIDYERILNSRMFNLLTPDELKTMEAFGIDVQLHTHRHTFPANENDVARRELIENRTYLESALDRRLTHFCYPSGVWESSNFSILDKVGIDSATTCEPGLNANNTEHLALYRCLDQDNLSDIEFEAELYGFCELIRCVTGRRLQSEATRKRLGRNHDKNKSYPGIL